jgi:hypothetical protein
MFKDYLANDLLENEAVLLRLYFLG